MTTWREHSYISTRIQGALNFNERAQNAPQGSESQFNDFWKKYRDRDQLFTGRDIIVRSVCPQLYGLFFVKLAVLLTLVGGSETQAEGGVRRRSQSHLLIVGDPGCGKSQILRFAASVASRSVLTTGIGTTGAGLTCTAIRDGSDWILEAGALVLSNDGLCCIDEFSSIKENDRATIHEAMEQQTLSVAKAGLVVKLNTRSTVLACCNPKGTFDVTADITTNTAIASPLLSRFDLILILLDSPDKEWDKRVSTFLLQQAVNANPKVGNETSARDMSRSIEPSGAVSRASKQDGGGIDADEKDSWSLNVLRQYVAYVKATIHPVMGAAAKCLLLHYYQLQRQNDERSSARTTVRLLESLVRLSEAHAKIMCRQEVILEDAVTAVTLMSLSHAQGSLLQDNNSILHSPFPTDAKASYAEQEAKVMRLLHCTRKSLMEEAEQLSQGKGQGQGQEYGFDSFADRSTARSTAGMRMDVDAPFESFEPLNLDLVATDQDGSRAGATFIPKHSVGVSRDVAPAWGSTSGNSAAGIATVVTTTNHKNPSATMEGIEEGRHGLMKGGVGLQSNHFRPWDDEETKHSETTEKQWQVQFPYKHPKKGDTSTHRLYHRSSPIETTASPLSQSSAESATIAKENGLAPGSSKCERKWIVRGDQPPSVLNKSQFSRKEHLLLMEHTVNANEDRTRSIWDDVDSQSVMPLSKLKPQIPPESNPRAAAPIVNHKMVKSRNDINDDEW